MKFTIEDFNTINNKNKKGVDNNLLPNVVLNQNKRNDFDFYDLNIADRSLPNVPIDKKYYDSFAKYDVIPNQYSDEKDLIKQRAKNQSAVEQFARFTKQVAVNELALGTLRGFSDIFDAAYNYFKNEGYNDYTNPVSSLLEEAQEKYRTNNEIYQKDPDKAFAFNDFGWYMNGLVNIGSTLSLAIPGMTIGKGVSLAGRMLGKTGRAISKNLRTINKLDNAVNKTEFLYSKIRPSQLLTKLDGTGAITGSQKLNHELIKGSSETLLDAFLMRTAENYQEAREVHKEIEEQAKSYWENASEEEKERIKRIRPDFENVTAEEYAKIMASESADQVMRNNYALLILDAFQLRSVTNVLKSVFKNTSSGALKNFNRKEAADLLRNLNSENVINPTIYSNIKNNLKDISIPFYSELSEGFEEAYQGIQSEKGKEKFYKLINPNYIQRSLNSYLSDPEIWNQAFWGYIGGVGFHHGMRGYEKAKTGILNLYDKYKYKDADKVPPRLTIEKLQEQEITNRSIKFGKLLIDLKSLDEGTNPYVIEDEEGYKDINREIYRDLDPVKDRDIIKEGLLKDAITSITLDAVDVGNYGLLKDFLKDKNFKRYAAEAFPSDIKIDEYVEKQFNDIADDYYTELKKVISSVNGGNERILSILARENLRIKQISDILKDKADSMQSEIDKIIPTSDNELQLEVEQERIKSTINEFEKAIKEYERINDTDKTKYSSSVVENKKYLDNRIKELRNRLKLYKSIQSITNNEDLSNYDLAKTIIKDFSNKSSKLSTTQKELIQEQENYRIESKISTALNTNNSKDIQERYNIYSSIIERSANEAITKAYNNLLKRSIENINDPTVLYQLADPNSEIFKDLNKDRELLQIAFDGGYYWQTKIEKELDARRKIDEAVDKIVDIQTPKETITNQETIKEDSPTFTGEQKEKIITSETPNDFVFVEQPEDIIEPTEDDKKIVESTLDEDVAKYDKKGLINVVRAITARLKRADETLDGDRLKQLVEEKLRNLNLYFEEDILEDALTSGIIEGISYYEKSKNTPLFAMTSTIGEVLPKDVIDKYIKWYIENKNIKPNKNRKVYIDLNELFYDMLDDENITFEDAKTIYIHLKDYVKENKDNNYKFVNVRDAYQIAPKSKSWGINRKAAEQYFDKLIRNRTKFEISSDAIHVVPANDFLKKSKEEKQTILQKLQNGDALDPVMDSKQIIFMNNNSPLVRLATYNFNGNTNTFKSNQSYGFSYTLRENNGNIETNFDKLFNIIINETEDIADVVNNYIVNLSNSNLGNQRNLDTVLKLSFAKNENISLDNVINFVLNNKEIIELINNGSIKFPKYINSKEEKAAYILDELRKLFNYNNVIAASSIVKRISINQWKKRKYLNAQETYAIQQAIEENKPINIKVDNLDNGEAVLSKIPTNISDNNLKLNYKQNPFVTISDGKIIVEGSNETYYTGIKNGRIGLLIRGGNNPVVALPAQMSSITENSPLYNDLKEELKNIIRKRLNNGGFEEFVDELNGLFGGKNTSHNNLFYGFVTSKAATKSGNIVYGLSLPGENKYLLVAYKYKNNGTPGTGFSFYENGDSKGIGFYKADDNLIEKIVNNILKYTKFNATHIALRSNADETSTLNNDKYIRKENGKYIIKLNNKEHTYENFADYAIKNGIFSTYQSIDSSGNYFVRNPESIYIKTEIGETPHKGENVNKIRINVRNIFPQGSRTSPYNTKTTLLKLGVEEYIANAIIDLGLSPQTIYYRGENIPDNLKGAYASYDSKTDSINFYKPFIDYINKSPNKSKSAIRILLHENIHRQFNKNGYRTNKEVINEIIDTWNEFIENIKDSNDSVHKEIMKHINEWNYFSIDDFAKKYPNDAKEQLRQRFAEEIIAESFTQSAIFNALNNIESTRGDSTIKDTKHSLFQKIINSILKLLGLKTNNIKNNTILARQYNLFANVINNNNENNINENAVENNNINEDTSIEELDDEKYIKQNNEEIIEEQSIENIEEYFDDLFSITDDIDAGILTTNSIANFIESFEPSIQPKIANFVRNGGINFKC